MERFRRIADIVFSEHNDLRRLAEIAEANPKTFFRACNMSGTDLRGTDLRGFDLTDCMFDGVQYNNDTKVDDEFKRYFKAERSSVTIRVDSPPLGIEEYISKHTIELGGSAKEIKQLIAPEFIYEISIRKFLDEQIKESKKYLGNARGAVLVEFSGETQAKKIEKNFLRGMLIYAVNNKRDFSDLQPQSYNQGGRQHLISIPRQYREFLNSWAKELSCSRADLIRGIVQSIINKNISVMRVRADDSGRIAFVMERGAIYASDLSSFKETQ